MSLRIAINGFGRFAPHVEASEGSIVVDGHAIPTFAEADPAALPWADLDVDVVLECTGALRSRAAAALNLVPTSTGAAKAIGLVIPELAGKLHGYAARVPVATGSLVDLTVEVERPTTAEVVNDVFAGRADHGELEGILGYSEEPLVSSDVIGSSYSAVFDAGLTTVVDGTQVKVVAWYDNEWGYSTRLVELAQRVLVPVTGNR